MNEGGVTEVFEDHREINEHQTDWDDEKSDVKGHTELVNRACVTRPSRPAVLAFVLLDM